jgi:xanthine/CO dehydrogenase XdhC/CoxF family maturation factor
VCTASGRLFGSVSGGCVEADVAERAKAVLAGAAPEVVSYGIADDEAWSVGLPCGGEIDVFVEPFSGPPPIERGTSYVAVAGEKIGARWHDDTPTRTELRGDVFAEAVGPPRDSSQSAPATLQKHCARSRNRSVAHGRGGSTRRSATRERVSSADELVVQWPDEIEVDEETASSRSYTRSGSTSRL